MACLMLICVLCGTTPIVLLLELAIIKNFQEHMVDEIQCHKFKLMLQI